MKRFIPVHCQARYIITLLIQGTMISTYLKVQGEVHLGVFLIAARKTCMNQAFGDLTEHLPMKRSISRLIMIDMTNSVLGPLLMVVLIQPLLIDMMSNILD